MLQRGKYGVCVLVLSLLMTGCTNLAAVRQYAETADASLAGVPGVVGDFVSACERRVGFQPASHRQDCGQVKASAVSLQELVTLLQKYNQSLGKLAADEAVTYTANLQQLEQQINTLNRLQPAQVAAVISVADYLSALTTERYRKRTVKQVIQENNDAVQVMAALLATIIEIDYRALLEGEKLAVTKYYGGLQARYAESEPLALSLALRERDSQLGAVTRKLDGIAPLVSLVRQVGVEHSKLHDRVDALDSQAVLQQVRAYVDQTKPVLQKIKDAYH